jgi:hypothetical protein
LDVPLTIAVICEVDPARVEEAPETTTEIAAGLVEAGIVPELHPDKVAATGAKAKRYVHTRRSG